MEAHEVPRTMTVEGRDWTAGEYADGDGWKSDVEFGWKTPMLESEYDWDPEAVDFNILGGDVPHYFIFIQKVAEGTFSVEASATNGPNYHRSGMAEGIGSDFYDEVDGLGAALETAEEFMERVAARADD